MTTDLSTLPNSALLLRIVAAERDCTHCQGTGLAPREVGEEHLWYELCCCHHGKVPILDPKLMRLSCPCSNNAGSGYWCFQCSKRRRSVDGYADEYLTPARAAIHAPDCANCRGDTWVPNPDAWDMRKALHLAGFQLIEGHTMYSHQDKYPAICYRYLEQEATPRIPILDADPKRARHLAVARAFGI